MMGTITKEELQQSLSSKLRPLVSDELVEKVNNIAGEQSDNCVPQR